MVASSRNNTTTIVRSKLEHNPYGFNFYQLMRAADVLNYIGTLDGSVSRAFPVGHMWPVDCELVHFQAHQTYSFPTSAIYKIAFSEKGNTGTSEFVVNFMGLTGIAGVLPSFYTNTVVRQHQLKNDALNSLFNMFNHRSISFYYRCWEKYHFEVSYERARRAGRRDDIFTNIMGRLAGFGVPALRDRLSVPQDSLLHFAGIINQKPHNALNLCQMLEDYFDVNLTILEYRGMWEKIEKDECTRLPSRQQPAGQYNILSENAVLGDKVYNSQNHFRLRVGPLSFSLFLAYLPSGKDIKAFVQLARLYAGMEYNFELQLVLNEDEIPVCKLDADNPPRLGWTTWLDTDTARKNGIKQENDAVVLFNSIVRL